MQGEYFMTVGLYRDNSMQLSEYKYETLHNRLLQDKEMTVRHDCDQSECVFLQKIPHLSLYYLLLLLLIFKRDLNYIHYIQCLTNVLEQIDVICYQNKR